MATTRYPTPHDWREGRRLRAWELAQAGWTQRTIAAALGVTEGAVSQWRSRARVGGVAALRRRPSPGTPPKLARDRLAQVPALLARGPAAFGFRGDVWTCARIVAVIETHCGVRYHPAHVSRLVRPLRLTPQRPIQRATQPDEAAIDRWYRQHWPALKKGRPKKASPSPGETSLASLCCPATCAPTRPAGRPRCCVCP
jgi:transposase